MRNKIAKELSSRKYDQRIIPNKKKDFDVITDHVYTVGNCADDVCEGGRQCTYPYCECVMY